MIIWRKQQRRARAQRFHDQVMACQRAWGPFVGITDLADPHGKRFLFDDLAGMPQQSTSPLEGISCSLLTPLRANQPYDPYTPGVWCAHLGRHASRTPARDA